VRFLELDVQLKVPLSKGEAQLVLRRFIFLFLVTSLTLGVSLVSSSNHVQAQDKSAKKEKSEGPLGQVTAEQVVELAIYLNGGREGMAQIRRTGIERGRIKRAAAEGKTEEATYERRFIRGENMEKDRTRLDQKMPTSEYALIFADGHVWGLINETTFTPRQESAQEFMTREWHGLESLLRYKENGSTITYLGKEKHKGLELHVVDVTDKEQRRTRYYISAKSARILWLEYNESNSPGGTPVKYSRNFHDYRLAQGTLVPYRTVLFRDGVQIEETQIMTVTYGQKLDEALFRNPDAATSTTASKP
jgi:hypothetical protein